MSISKKTALSISLSVIVLYWLYELLIAKNTGELPASFFDLAIKIAINKSIQLIVIILLLRFEKDSWQDMGFDFKNWKKQLLMGLLIGLIMFLLLNVGLSSVLNSVFPPPAKSGSILAYFTDTRNLYAWLAIGIFGGGVVEEVMRIFFLTRFEKRFNRIGLYFALLCSSLIFGLGHLYQGPGTAISTGISGLILGFIYIKRRSAIELITIHAFSDVLAILGAYQLAMHH